MPTGHTSHILEGCSFKTFAESCALSIVSYDESKLVKHELNDFYPKKLKEAQKIMKKYNAFSDDDWKVAFEFDRNKQIHDFQACIDQWDKKRSQYEAMLIQVNAWIPPTTKHQYLKKYMIDQITGSINYDCPKDNTFYKDKIAQVAKLTLDQYKTQIITELKRDISRYAQQIAEELKGKTERDLYIDQLEASLGVN